jgi:hypothetical protein
MMRQTLHQTVSWSSGYDFPLTIALSKCSGKVLGSIPRETIFLIFFFSLLVSFIFFIFLNSKLLGIFKYFKGRYFISLVWF